jgi:glycosyltransferase involved in cell wall biosynthesis
MKGKIYYLTRTYYPYQKGGGPLMRKGAVRYLQELGWDVTVVMPNYDSYEILLENNIIQIPFSRKHIQKLSSLLERLGVYEDYLDKWVEDAFNYLQTIINAEDIVFATSGGELGMIKLGSSLKEKLACKFVVNFRDPLDYSLVNNQKLDNKFHVSRERQESKYLSNSDLIITSSKVNQLSLISKYPQLKKKIKNNYFGYVKKINIERNERSNSNKLRIAYAGNMGTLQKPEILYEVYKKLSDKKSIEIYFIGDISCYAPLQGISDSNVKFINFMPHDEFLDFMSENIDIGFVSLTSDYLGACVPSKIYEYINLELPMIGALPEGDGMEIINDNGYGVACKYNDLDGLLAAIGKFTDRNYLNSIKQNLVNDKELWDMGNRIKEINLLLRELVA